MPLWSLYVREKTVYVEPRSDPQAPSNVRNSRRVFLLCNLVQACASSHEAAETEKSGIKDRKGESIWKKKHAKIKIAEGIRAYTEASTA
jgi:hypothetical protein